jgi:hypothetical protein
MHDAGSEDKAAEKSDLTEGDQFASHAPNSTGGPSTPVSVTTSAVAGDTSLEGSDSKDIKAEVDEVGIERVRLALGGMLSKLQNKIETAESDIGDRLQLLDKNRDGLLDVEELKEIMQTTLKRSASEVEIEELIQAVDSDKDGLVSVEEFLKYIQKRKEMADEEKENID